MNKTIVVLPGDGIGPEIVSAAIEVLQAVEARFGHRYMLEEHAIGGAAIDTEGVPLPDATLSAALASDGVLLGAVGGPKWDSLPGDQRPEKGLLRIRKELGLYANLRPATMFAALRNACPLRAEIAQEGFDMLMFRELIGGVYFGEHKTEEQNGERVATDIMSYSESEIECIVEMAFKAAKGRRGKVTSVDKANVLDTSRLWRSVAARIAQNYPEVEFENMLVDNAAMQLVKNPAQFDVVVTENMFGDILSDEASMITGSIGMIPSASLGEARADGSYHGMYEPIHGSAPDIAGQDKANPVGTILSAAMLLRYSLNMEAEAKAVEAAVDAVLAEGIRTGDIAAGGPSVGCREMGSRIATKIHA